MFQNVSLLTCSVALAAWLDVLVVQPNGPAGTFSDIQSACNQAHERDTILIKAGSYSSFEVVDKWLTIAADVGGSVTVNGGISVRDLAAGKRVTLRGLTSSGASGVGNFFEGLRLTMDHGPVRIMSCAFQGVGPGFPGGDGVSVDHCDDVSLSHCVSSGGIGATGYAGPDRGGHGVSLTHSSVALHDCVLSGGYGLNSIPPPADTDGADGGDGCNSDASVLFASATTFQGAHGGDCALSFGLTDAGSGGNGLTVGNGGIARLVSPTATGGAAGFGPNASAGWPLSGSPILTQAVSARRMTVGPDPIREGTSLTISVNGQPGDAVGLVLTPFTSSTFNAAWNGQQLFPAGTPFLRFGTIPAGGTLVQHLPIADLGPGVASRTYQMQALFAGTDGHRVLGTPVSLVVLDSAY